MIPRLSLADDASVYLRTIVRYALGEADTALDPARHIESTLIQIDTINTRGNIRLALTKEYALRVLQFHQRMYEEMVSRDLNSAPRSTSRSQNPTDDTGLDDIIGQLSL